MASSSTFSQSFHFNHFLKIPKNPVSAPIMEESKNHILQPRKLNLNVPPLSTRRSSIPPSSNTLTLSLSKSTTTNMVPFAWERIPGEPKDKQPSENSDSFDLPPPPGRRQPPPAEEISDIDCSVREYHHDEHFSDAIDIFSLAESLDDSEENCKATKNRSSTKEEAEAYDDYGSSNFIMQRFLPDAQALAEASVMNKEIPFQGSPCSSPPPFSRAVGVRRSCHSMKGCGLGGFLPWRMKPKPCSAKSPVCDTIIGPNPMKKR